MCLIFFERVEWFGASGTLSAKLGCVEGKLDDIVAKLRTFLRVAFGAQHLEANLRCLRGTQVTNKLRSA